MKIAIAIRRLAVFLAWASRRAVTEWREAPVHCAYCGCASNAESVSAGENVAWCRRCRQVYTVPAFKVPGWVTGVLAVLIINVGLL